MTNYEKYKNLISDILVKNKHLVISKQGVPQSYCFKDCSHCLLDPSDGRDCNTKKIYEWLNAEYKNPPYKIKWEKVPKDTPIIVTINGFPQNRHFSHYEDNKIFYFADGKTSWTEINKDYPMVCPIDQAKLRIMNPEWVEYENDYNF